MAVTTSTLEGKSAFEFRLDDLRERDFENALELCQEAIDKISRIFEVFLLQEMADFYMRFLAVGIIVNLHFEMCCLHDWTARVFSWVNKSQTAPL